MFCFAHRGASGEEPENTLRAFKKAIEQGAQGIELDVRWVDGEILVIHDDRLERTSNGFGIIYDQPLSTLRALDAGKGEKIPTLDEVFALITTAARRICLNIEIKDEEAARQTARKVDYYVQRQGWQYADILLSSRHFSFLEQIHRYNSKIPLAVVFDDNVDDVLDFAESIDAVALHPHLPIVDEMLVKKVHQRGFKVNVFTVNAFDYIARIQRIAVDGIFSNFPERVLQFTASKSRCC